MFVASRAITDLRRDAVKTWRYIRYEMMEDESEDARLVRRSVISIMLITSAIVFASIAALLF